MTTLCATASMALGDHVNLPKAYKTSEDVEGFFRSGVALRVNMCRSNRYFRIEFWLPVPPDSSLFVLPSHRLTSDVRYLKP